MNRHIRSLVKLCGNFLILSSVEAMAEASEQKHAGEDDGQIQEDETIRVEQHLVSAAVHRTDHRRGLPVSTRYKSAATLSSSRRFDSART